ncbi:MAG TPA: bifunctional methylenetetrahydrofolate dehydrogenase/methenyltetrahydrofolate cyclohydrolase FolD [Pirellulaceae bacterium]|nr:bifunctional methylenetetrahydrofolate dehydrogenase/methenyltetrahydrofolate cyclohydrolase FolD [Pirellulaceae bacterium]HMO90807.1 bifunctional methylenetetrahydrofolate dehydrogenase/methenyltetrahydrofolate cyclohydrolase FolD [Pirellulaceae bacterium]HMP68058.1 bifunctional methylenetetrahydrofolate dehydrogenase/methenyltetrahydrofolate cyclohydrolase FolD [Pirellulaceae bacterium]
MTAKILDGRETAKTIQAEIRERVSAFRASGGPTPTLAAVLVGDDPASHVYVSNKQKACERAGISSQLHRLDAASSSEAICDVVQSLNQDSDVHGILVQLPLPRHVDAERILDLVDPLKDVDAFHPENVGLLSQGRPRYLPCTPHGIIQILHRYQIDCAGKHVVVIGRSDIVGKPIAMLLSAKDSPLGPGVCNATVTLCHSRTPDLKAFTRQADVVVAAIGKADFVNGDMLKPGAVVIDVGINRTEQGLTGDVDFASASQVASYITPVPGGIGPLTVSMLLENTLEAANHLARMTAHNRV